MILSIIEIDFNHHSLRPLDIALLVPTPQLDAKERSVLDAIVEAQGRLRYSLATPRRWTGHLRRTAWARAVSASNTIEGYRATVEDALAVAIHEEPPDADPETKLALQGYQRAMTWVLQLASGPDLRYSTDILKSLHFMMLEHDIVRNPGQWRTSWVGVRDGRTGEVTYEGAPAEDCPSLVQNIADQLNAGESATEPVMVRAAMAHLNLVLVHPFSDGNGRMARCLQALVLTRGGTLPQEFASIEEYVGRYQLEYYAVLREVGGPRWTPDVDARPWIRFCLTAHYRQAVTILRREAELQLIWEKLEEELRVRGLPERSVTALVDAAYGWKVRNTTYRAHAEVSQQTATRDLKMLVEADMLRSHGERRGRHYLAGPVTRALVGKSRSPQRIPDPFNEPGSLER